MAATICLGWNKPLRADSENTSSEREKLLEQRINFLEQRLKRLEKLLPATAADKSPSHPSASRHAGSRPPSIQPPDHLANTQESAPASEVKTNPSTAQMPDEPARPGTGQPDDAPQELNILRENAVTLQPASFEVSNEFDYIQRQSNLQRDRAVLSTTALRYGVLNWLELSATIPFGYSTRVSDTSPVSAATRHVSGIGDLVLQANARLIDQTINWPGMVLSLGVIVPTGASPYDLTGYRFSALSGIPAPSPRNPLADYFSQGSWGLHSNLQIYKSIDPIILFFGFGWDKVFPVNLSGFTIDGYNRWSYNLGLSLALSEKTTLGFSSNGSYTPDQKVNGHVVFQSAMEPTFARLTVIQRIMRDVYLEPSISFGLDQDSPDFILGLGIRARF